MRGLVPGTILVVLVLVGAVYAVVRARRILRGTSDAASGERMNALLATARRLKADAAAVRHPAAEPEHTEHPNAPR